MKQSLKYGLLLVLALLIHSVVNQTMENYSKELTPTHNADKCFVSQAHPIPNALELLYHLYTTQSCDLNHADLAHIPTDKSMQLLASHAYGHKSQLYSSFASADHIPKYLSDPIAHYIYGLRKIII